MIDNADLTKEELKSLLKLQMKQANSMLDLDDTKEGHDKYWNKNDWDSNRYTFYSLMKSINKNRILLEKMDYNRNK